MNLSKLINICPLNNQGFAMISGGGGIEAGFNLTTRDIYFMILVEVFMNHILVENTYFTNHIE